MLKYLVVDLEVSAVKSFKRFANPLDPRNSITLVAYKPYDYDEGVVECNPVNYKKGFTAEEAVKLLDLHNYDLLVGQNLKFDLLYLWSSPTLQEWLKNGGRVWDTQTAEYLLSGQQAYGDRDLDTLALKYGGKIKDDRIKVLYGSGLQSKDIDSELLMPYAKGDVENTDIVFRGQEMKVTYEYQMSAIIALHMSHYVAVCDMEYNGLAIDLDLGMEKAKMLESELESLTAIIREHVVHLVPGWPSGFEFNPASNRHVGVILFGGEIKTRDREIKIDNEGNELFFKSGQKKGQKQEHWVLHLHQLTGFKHEVRRFIPAELSSTTDEVLNIIIQKVPKLVTFCEFILKYRHLAKLLGTYYYTEIVTKTGDKKTTGMLSLIHPHTGCVHSAFKTAQTATGRLSSNTPNVQNLPPEILDIVKSRWDDGVLVEIDFSQLEVCVQAFLAQCPRMIEDIKNKVDFHCKRLSYAEDLPYQEVVDNCQRLPEWKKKRKNAKTISFQKAYGAGPEKIAQSTGLSVDTVKRIFAQEDMEYPEIGIFYKDVLREVQNSRIMAEGEISIKDKHTGLRIQRKGEGNAVGYFQSITKKRYSFMEKAVLTKRGDIFRYFPIPDIQNYPVQGTAADLVAGQVSRVYKFLKKNSYKSLLINEIHDAILLDVKKDEFELVIPRVCAILKDVETLFLTYFKLDWNIPMNVDVSNGRTWKEVKENE